MPPGWGIARERRANLHGRAAALRKSCDRGTPPNSDQPAPEPRKSATTVLMRDRPQVGKPEILMVQRHARDAFAAGAYVFPGGVMEEDDTGPRAAGISGGVTPAEARALLATHEPAGVALGYFVTSIRETFEEVGVLLAKTASGSPWSEGGIDPGDVRDARRAMQKGTLNFVDWIASQGLRLATGDMTYFAHWITPEGRPKRFDARFFLVRVSDEQMADPDRREIVDFRWYTPREALDEAAAGTIWMVNATSINLDLLKRFSSTEEAIEELRKREVRAVLPKLIPNNEGGFRILHPWDAEYDSH